MAEVPTAEVSWETSAAPFREPNSANPADYTLGVVALLIGVIRGIESVRPQRAGMRKSYVISLEDDNGSGRTLRVMALRIARKWMASRAAAMAATKSQK